MTYPRNTTSDSLGDIAGKKLLAIIERVERLHEERQGLGKDIADIYGEAKSAGLDPRIIKKVVAIRRQDRDKRIEEITLVDLYLAATGDA